MLLQWRNGFYYAAMFVLGIIAILLIRWRPANSQLWLPIMVWQNLVLGTFYFIAGLVLLEKDEGTITAQVVTPLNKQEYLLSKILTLSALASIENLIIVFLVVGNRFHFILLLAGMIQACAIYALFGFIAVAQYDSMNEFLFPSLLYTVFFVIPVVDYLGILPHPLFWLHPLKAPLVILASAFEIAEKWKIIYGLSYSAVWIAVLFYWSRRSFDRFLVSR